MPGSSRRSGIPRLLMASSMSFRLWWPRPANDRFGVLCHECRRSTRRRATVLEMKEGPSGSAIRSPIPSHRRLLRSRAVVVSVAETPGQDPGRHGRERRAQANPCRSVESGLGDARTGERIAAAFADGATSTEVAERIKEAEAMSVASEEAAEQARTRALDPALSPAEVAEARRQMEDAAFRRDRMQVAVQKLGERLKERQWREENQRRQTAYDKVKAERDASPRSWRACIRPSLPNCASYSRVARQATARSRSSTDDYRVACANSLSRNWWHAALADLLRTPSMCRASSEASAFPRLNGPCMRRSRGPDRGNLGGELVADTTRASMRPRQNAADDADTLRSRNRYAEMLQ